MSENKGKSELHKEHLKTIPSSPRGEGGPREEWTVTRASTDLYGRFRSRTWVPRAYSKVVGSSQGLHQLLGVPKEGIPPMASGGRYRR